MTEARRLLRLRRLANVSETRITGETFEQDPAFDLQRCAERSFGVLQERPVKVVLRFDFSALRRESLPLLLDPSPQGSLLAAAWPLGVRQAR